MSDVGQGSGHLGTPPLVRLTSALLLLGAASLQRSVHAVVLAGGETALAFEQFGEAVAEHVHSIDRVICAPQVGVLDEVSQEVDDLSEFFAAALELVPLSAELLDLGGSMRLLGNPLADHGLVGGQDGGKHVVRRLVLVIFRQRTVGVHRRNCEHPQLDRHVIEAHGLGGHQALPPAAKRSTSSASVRYRLAPS